jgi:hypothetical protein
MAADHLSSRMTIAERAILFTAWLATSLLGAVFISSNWLTKKNAETAMNASIAFDYCPLVETDLASSRGLPLARRLCVGSVFGSKYCGLCSSR